MADLLPSSPDPSAGDGGEPRVIGVDSEDAADLLSALQSETAREVLGVLYDDPATPSALAEEADTSIQNVRYHLDKLADADLVEVADTVYSEKGREMEVYAPTAKPLVVFAGGDDDPPGLESALSELLGALGILGLSSILVQRLFGGPSAVGAPATDVEFQGDDSGGHAAGTTEAQDANLSAPNSEAATSTTTEVADSGQQATTAQAETTTEAVRTTVTESAESGETLAETTRTIAETTTADGTAEATTTAIESGAAAAGGLPPGLLFFAGGLAVLLALGAARYLRGR
jgi:DNA-binding transcriptional ArsR family regulator